MICSSLNLLFYMSVIPHGLTDFATSHWYGWQGAGQIQICCGDGCRECGVLVLNLYDLMDAAYCSAELCDLKT